MSDERSARLRGKRNEVKERARDQASKSSKPSEPDETDETDKQEQTGEPDETASTTEPAETDEPAESDEPDEPDRTGETDGSDETGDGDEPDASDESDESDDDTERVKDEQVGTYFYLPEGQRDELRYQYKRLSAEYDHEFGDDLEKNRHFYPLLVEYGLERLDGADAHDVREMLERLDY